MNNLDCAVAVLSSHREARQWNDEAVAIDLLAQLGLDAAGDAAHARPVAEPGITEDEVVAAETAAKEAADKAKEARDKLNAQSEPGAADQAAAQQAKAEADADAQAKVDADAAAAEDTTDQTRTGRQRGKS